MYTLEKFQNCASFMHYSRPNELCKRLNNPPEEIPAKDVPLEDFFPQDEMVKLIYAPDPINGFPRGDLAFYLDSKTAPEVRQYIMDRLAQPNATNGFAPDEETAEMTLIPRSAQFANERQSYINDVTAFVQSLNQQKDGEDIE